MVDVFGGYADARLDFADLLESVAYARLHGCLLFGSGGDIEPARARAPVGGAVRGTLRVGRPAFAFAQ